MINECLHVNNYFANTNLARQGETNYIAELTIPSCIDHHQHPPPPWLSIKIYKPVSQAGAITETPLIP